MQEMQKPAPWTDGSRILETVFQTVENLKEHTENSLKDQQHWYIQQLISEAPDEALNPLICRHWPITSKQQFMAMSEGQEGARNES